MKLQKGQFYCMPHIGGFSFGTYLGKVGDLLIFNGSLFAADSNKLHGFVKESDIVNYEMIQIPHGRNKTEVEVFKWLESNLPE